MGIKLVDGSTLAASELLSGRCEDDNGKAVVFKLNPDSEIPTYSAESDLNDGTGRKRLYSFSIGDTNVIVHMGTKDPKAEEEAKKKQEESVKAAEEAKAASSSTSSSTTTYPATTTTAKKK